MVNVYLSDVFFNMENDATIKTLVPNAEMLINMLRLMDAKDIPTVEELLADFWKRY